MFPTDHSEAISRVKALLSVLADLEPDGRWQRNATVKRYRRSPYSLTHGEFAQMSVFLELEVKLAELEVIPLGGEDDAQS